MTRRVAWRFKKVSIGLQLCHRVAATRFNRIPILSRLAIACRIEHAIACRISRGDAVDCCVTISELDSDWRVQWWRYLGDMLLLPVFI